MSLRNAPIARVWDLTVVLIIASGITEFGPSSVDLSHGWQPWPSIIIALLFLIRSSSGQSFIIFLFSVLKMNETFVSRAYLFRGVGDSRVLVASALLLVLYGLIGMRSRVLDAPWRVDEGQRIAEGYCWRLLRAGDMTNPDWFRTIAFRSHPPVSKYFYGAAVELAGVPPPRNMDLARAYDAGTQSDTMPERFVAEYLPMRRPAREASFLASVLTAVIVFAILLKMQGVFPAALSQVLLFRHYLFVSALFYARSDTVQTLCVSLTIGALFIFTGRRSAAGEALAGIFAAFAFQTRLNGGVALVSAIVYLAVIDFGHRRLLRRLLVLVLTFAVVSVAINPYYWAQPRPAPGVPPILLHQPLVFRIFERFAIQIHELGILLAGVPLEWHLTSIPSRLAFTASVLFSGVAGILIATGLLLVVICFRFFTTSVRAIIAAALTAIGMIAIWIPLRWDMYLLMLMPLGVLAACIGCGTAARLLLRLRAE